MTHVCSMLETYPKDVGHIDQPKPAECIAAQSEHTQLHEHCTVCAEACRRCEQARADLISSLG